MTATSAPAVLDRDGPLVAALVAWGRTIIGPTVGDCPIVPAELASVDALPHGWGVEPDAGRYRPVRREDQAAFAHSADSQSWKNFPHPSGSGCGVPTGRRRAAASPTPRMSRQAPSYAFLGVRPCDLLATTIQDRWLTGSTARSHCRQWLTQKLSTWHDRFGTYGCVGCGRRTAWSPAGIDVTKEVAALHAEHTAPGTETP
ncbi:4Fe-4S dicluster domain-containing protein [Streptomyces phaeochromogenes]